MDRNGGTIMWITEKGKDYFAGREVKIGVKHTCGGLIMTFVDNGERRCNYCGALIVESKP